MQAWKEKVAGKLSRILTDSSQPPSHTSKESPVVRPGSQGIPVSAEELHRLDSPSLSSYLLSLLPTVNVDRHKSNKLAGGHDSPLSPFRLLPSRWRSKKFAWKDRPLDCNSEFGLDHGSYETLENYDEYMDQASDRSTNDSNKFEESSMAHNLDKFLPDFLDESSFISLELYEFLQSCIPNIVKGCQWVLLYSTLKHGVSLRTLIHKSFDLPGPCLLIAGDRQGAVFGGLLECPLKATAKGKYQGTNQTFVFTTIYGEPRLFRATGANRYYYLCLDDLLALAGGGNFALCLDGDLLHGTSGPSDTFGNLCLANSPEFELKNVELWGFTHSITGSYM